MLGRDRVVELLKNLTREAKKNGAGQAETLYVGSHGSTTRFANSSVMQNVMESNRTIYFRVLLGKQVGMASTNSLHGDDLRRCLNKAIAIAKQNRSLKFFYFLP